MPPTLLDRYYFKMQILGTVWCWSGRFFFPYSHLSLISQLRYLSLDNFKLVGELHIYSWTLREPFGVYGWIKGNFWPLALWVVSWKLKQGIVKCAWIASLLDNKLNWLFFILIHWFPIFQYLVKLGAVRFSWTDWGFIKLNMWMYLECKILVQMKDA